jgi:hypothetical protein
MVGVRQFWCFSVLPNRPQWSGSADASTGEFDRAFYCSGLYPIPRRRNFGQNRQGRVLREQLARSTTLSAWHRAESPSPGTYLCVLVRCVRRVEP